ncbi:MAG: PTS sugar transporter subunit IIA [Brevinema sp.]
MFNLFKKSPKELIIYAPLSGTILPLSASPDEAFAQGMLGEGLCIDPDGDTVYAPFDGTIEIFHTLHAIGCKKTPVEMIIHIGMNTVNLKGEGFKALVPLEGKTTTGTPLLNFDQELLKSKTDSLITPIIIIDKPESAKLELLKTSGAVTVGEPIIKILL